MWKKYLQRIVLIAIVILGAKTAVENFGTTLADDINDTAVIANWEKRIVKLTAPIPFEHGFIGYIASRDIAQGDASNDKLGEFILTQYTVAPLILVRGADQEWNILNLDHETFTAWSQENADRFEVVKSGGGMYLVRRVTP